MSQHFSPAEKKFSLADIDPRDTGDIEKDDETFAQLEKWQKEIYDLHYLMYAENRRALLIILQGIDASGKDGTVRYLAGGMNPQGVKIHSFKKPNEVEIDHDYLWRIHSACPRRGEITIFNRSHYEEVAVVRVHPEILKSEFLPPEIATSKKIWKQRYRQIRDFETMLTENGTVVLKFLLHISRDEQQERLAERINDPKRAWKFAAQDLVEREYWDSYMKAFEEMVQETNTKVAPWHIIRADRKWFRNYQIGSIVVDTLNGLKMEFPKLDI